MINVKLIVFITCVNTVLGNFYCKICFNHTLCKYAMPGPGVSCKLYDKTAYLTENDIKEIIKKLNERRNYVAMGYSKFLPAAANMRKIIWSGELASFAQRWVDQCDQSLWPDKEDQCRDRKNGAVGQNIATIVGTSSNFNVKSFLDTWFIKILDYSGSVTYYNQSRNSKTKYFTQMIWADTNSIGCGRARFYVHQKNSMVERLVCNFAPQGNLHGKPVYAIGYPATQCPENTTPDETFKGLCRRVDRDEVEKTFDKVKNTSSSPRVSSLLRILNLSNSSAKQAIDPIRNNFKAFKPNANMTVEQRYQKIRHIENNTYGGMDGLKHYNVNPMQMPNLRFNQKYIPVTQIQDRRDYHEERGHSRVYHGHHLHNIEQMTTVGTTEQDYRRFNFMTDTVDVNNSPDYRKYNGNLQCTRKGAVTPCNTEIFYPKVQCTRERNKNCDQTHPSDSSMCQDDVPHGVCPCNIPKSICTTPTPIPTRCMCNVNCQCLNVNNPTTICPNYLRMQEPSDDTRKSGTINDYYDQFPNVGIRSGEKTNDNRNINKTITLKKIWQFKTKVPIQTQHQSSIYTKKYNYHGIEKSVYDFKEFYEDNMENMFRTPEFYRRLRRNLAEEVTFKPFWEMDELSQKKSPELKSLRYTTLSNKRHKISYRKPPISTESITINLSENNELNRKIVTEKYLSFDELMHLRKLGETDIDIYGARRQTTKKAAATTKAAAKTTAKKAATTKGAAKTTAKAATTKSTAKTTKKDATTTKAATKTTAKATTKPTTKSSIITANTPFERKKHCTRKLTCTWTAVTVTGIDGSVIGGMEIEAGSLTPPGYVDGCTRTSTCTRVYMNRNKFSTIGNDDRINDKESSGEEPPLHGDEDYCEKRALDVHRRESGREYLNQYSTSDSLLQISSPTTFNDNYEINTERFIHSHEPSAQSDCDCEENLRVKRDQIHFIDQSNMRETLSYGDLYYRVLQKVLSGWKTHRPSDNHKCACNYGIRNALPKSEVMIILFLII